MTTTSFPSTFTVINRHLYKNLHSDQYPHLHLRRPASTPYGLSLMPVSQQGSATPVRCMIATSNTGTVFSGATPKLPYKTDQRLVSGVQDIQNKKGDVCGSPIFLVTNITETNRILLYLLSVTSACLRVIWATVPHNSALYLNLWIIPIRV